MFNNIFKFGKNRKNNKNNKNIIIGLLILVIGIFLTTNILKNTSLFKFREGITVEKHMEDEDVYIDCNPVDSEGVNLVTVPQDPNDNSGTNTTNHITKIFKDQGAQFIIGIIVFLLVYNLAQRGFKAISARTEGHDRLLGGM
tara:strand:+ start:135 stop:560 length:426 start_codon:yes stop_codon:yes gene_type:complete